MFFSVEGVIVDLGVIVSFCFDIIKLSFILICELIITLRDGW